jgi:hypothetical protein
MEPGAISVRTLPLSSDMSGCGGERVGVDDQLSRVLQGDASAPARRTLADRPARR